jgi:hypothetical protein
MKTRLKVLEDETRQGVLRAITQPITATQLSRKLRLSFDRCNNSLLTLQTHNLVRCLNPTATRNHLFWLTQAGKDAQRDLGQGSCPSHDYPDIDWGQYASVCFSQRSEVIKHLTYPMQPSQIKRRATFHAPGLRISSNNARDVVRYLKRHGIVRPVKLKKKAHPSYELTEIGLQMRRLLLQAEVRA